ncbi:MAG: Fic family protein [Sulfurovum sp.]
MKLEEITKKLNKLNSLRPLSNEQLHNLKSFIDVEYTYHSNAIEGSTLSFSETKLILQSGLTIGGKPLSEHLEAINHRDAINFIEEISSSKMLTLRDIKDIHSIILRVINSKEAGSFRVRDVGVRKSDGEIHKFCEPLKIEDEMRELIEWFESDNSHIVIKSALLHLKFVTIHPFIDGNGRTARLLMNLILIQNGYPITIIKLQDRVEYIQAIEEYQESGDSHIFIDFIAKKVEDSLDNILDILTNNIKII